jgi:hypothetical protein
MWLEPGCTPNQLLVSEVSSWMARERKPCPEPLIVRKLMSMTTRVSRS